MFQLTESVTGLVLWANRHFPFCLSLLPFTTGWVGENHFEHWPTVLYGVNLVCCAMAYYMLQTCIVRHQGSQGLLAKAVARDFKGKASPVLYVTGIVTAWAVSAWAGMAFYVLVALMWLVPDRRVESVLVGRNEAL